MKLLIFDSIENKNDSSHPVNNFKLSKLYRTLEKINIPIKLYTKYDSTIKIAFNWLVNENKSIIPDNLKNNKNLKIINKNFNTQDKIDLEKFHIEAFGYGLNINTTKYDGYVFRKGRNHKYKWLNVPENLDFNNDVHSVNEKPKIILENKKHCLRYMIVKCPIKKQDDKSVYQKLINSRSDCGKYYKEYRIAIINYDIFCILELHKNKINENPSNCKECIVRKTKDFFENNNKMFKCIKKYIQLIGLEYGDLDVLADENKNLFIVDVNNGPMGDPYNQRYYRTIWDEYINEVKKMLLLS